MNRKKRKIGRAPLIILILIIILLIILFLNFRGNNIKLSKDERVLIVGKQNIFAVYEDKLAVKIPYELSVNKDTTIKDLVDGGNYEILLNKINEIMPERINRVIKIDNGEIKLDVENEKNIPETNIEDKRFILTSSVYSMFNEFYNKRNPETELNENILVDILNANGRGGYARKTGENLKQTLGVKYNAANYETQLEESYVILNDISKEKAMEIIEKLPEKYFKIKSKSTIPTLANMVVILGKESKTNLKIDIFTSDDKKNEVSSLIKKAAYKNINISTLKEDRDSIIEYNKEDYFVALKIGKTLGITNMLEVDNLKDKINVIVK